MVSEVDICNQAIASIGSSMFIQSITENSLQSIVCKQFYDQCRDQVLEEFPWNFADSYEALQDIGNPPPVWAYRYAYPNDCQKARELVLPAVNVPIGEWVHSRQPVFRFAIIEDQTDGGKAIVTNLQSAVLHYTKRIENPALFSAKFVETVATLLGSKIAAPLSAKPEYAQTLRQAYEQMKLQAGADTLNEGDNYREKSCDLLDARL